MTSNSNQIENNMNNSSHSPLLKSTTSKSNQQFFDFSIQTKHVKQPLNDDYQYTWKSPKRKNSVVLRSNQTCEICSNFISISTNILKCIYCNVVVHYSCFQATYSEATLIDKDHWVCYYCQDSLQYDKNYYEQINLLKNTHSLFHESQMKIVKNWKRYLQRKKYLRIYSCIVKLQIRFRIHQKKKAFLLSIQNKLRTVKIKIHSIMNVLLQDREADNGNGNGNVTNSTTSSLSPLKPLVSNNNNKMKRKRDNLIYFVITVYGSINQNTNDLDAEGFESSVPLQSWRIDSSNISVETFPNTTVDVVIDEKFVLGGVSGFQTIIITLFQKNTYNNGRDIFLGQTSLDLSRSYLWKSGGKFPDATLEDYQYDVIDSVSLSPIKVDLHFFEQSLPVNVFEPTINHPRFYEQQHIHSFLRKPMRRRVNGTISFEVITTNTMNSECCHCYGSCIEELIRELAKLPDSTGFMITNKKLLSAGHTLKTLNIFRSHQDTPASSSFQNNPDKSRKNTETSLFATTSSHDAKHQPAVNNHHSHQPTVRMKKMWISISDGKLYLFSHFGEQVKLIIDLQYFSVSFDFHYNEKNSKGHTNNSAENNATLKNNNNVIYKLYRMGYPEFHFYPCKEADIFPVKCAFITSLRFAKGFTVSSMNNNNNNSITADTSEKFDVNYLLEDLLALEILRTKRNAMKEAVSMSISTPTSSLKPTTANRPKSLAESRRGSTNQLSAINDDRRMSSSSQLPPITSAPPPLNKIKSARFQLPERDEMSKNRKFNRAATSNAINFEDLLHKVDGSKNSDISRYSEKRRSRSRSRSRGGLSSRAALTDDDASDDSTEEENRRFSENNDNDEDDGRSFRDDLRYSRDDADLPSTSTKSSSSLMKRAIAKSNKIMKQKSQNKSMPTTTTHDGSLLKTDIDESVLLHLNENQKKIYSSIVNDLENNKTKLTDEIKLNLIEQLSLDEMVINEKYQKYGENFIQNVMGKVTEHHILNRQYRHGTGP